MPTLAGMDGKPARKAPRSTVTFQCDRDGCGTRFEAEPGRIETDEEDREQPYRYFADCPDCGAEAEPPPYMKTLLRAWSCATGPKTEEGKEIVTRNLKGHPTPEEALRTRFNALKSGVYARTARFFPARPGKYAQCDGCRWRNNGCSEEDIACRERTELFMRYAVAFDTRDPGLLQRLHGDLHAGLFALAHDMLVTIVRDTAKMEAPVWDMDKDGNIHFVRHPDTEELLIERSAHPLLKPLGDLLGKMNLGLADLAMTPKVQGDREEDLGYLEESRAGREAMVQSAERIAQATERLPELMTRAQEEAGKDRVLASLDDQG